METQRLQDGDRQAKNETCACGNKWRDFVQRLRYDLIGRVLQRIAHQAAVYPISNIAFIVTFSFLIAITGLFTNFYIDASDYDQWTPIGSYPALHRDWYRYDSGFTTQWRSTAMLVHRNDGNNIATLEGLEFAFEALDVLQSVPEYDEICGVQYNCYLTGVTKFWDNNSTLFRERIKNDPDWINTISQKVYPDGYPVDFQREFGNPGMLWDGDLVYVQAFALLMVVRASDEVEVMEKGFADKIVAFQEEIKSKGSEFTVQLYTDRGFTDEFTRGIMKDLPLIPVAFFLMSMFTMIAFSKRHPVLSRSMLGLGAVCCVFCGIMAGFGLMFCIGVPFASMNQILPFILFGIGLDNAFIILGEFMRKDPKRHVVERIDETIGEVGSSIALTTITSSLAFGLGALSSVPAVKSLCHYAYTTILIIFLYQITFFVALLVLDERRIQANRRNCLPCWFSGKTITTADWSGEKDEGTKDQDGQKDFDHDLKKDLDEDGDLQQQTFQQVRLLDDCDHDHKGDDDNKSGDIDRTHITDRMMVWYAKKLLQPGVKFAVIVLFSVWFGLCLYSAAQLEQEFRFEMAIPKDSFLVGFVQKAQEYSEALSPFPSAFFRCVDQSDPIIQDQMIKYVDDLVNGLDEISEQPLFFWLRDFRRYIAHYANEENGLAELPFNEQLDYFLGHPIFYQLYDHVIVRDERTGDIVTSSTVIIMDNVDLETVEAQIKALDKQRQITMNQPINTVEGLSDRIVNAPYCAHTDETDFAFFLFHEQFQNWEFYSVAVYELILSTITGIIAVTIVGILLVPHWTAGLFVLPLICILYVDVLGILQFAGAHINAITYVSMIMSIGLMVDFIMHVMLRYYECDNHLTRHQKVIETMRTMGASILLGGTSSLIGVLPLWATQMELIQTIFKAFITLVVVGLSHGLIFLPVVLSVVGPLDTGSSSSHRRRIAGGAHGNSDEAAVVDGDHLYKEKQQKGQPPLDPQRQDELHQLRQQQQHQLQQLQYQHQRQLLQLKEQHKQQQDLYMKDGYLHAVPALTASARTATTVRDSSTFEGAAAISMRDFKTVTLTTNDEDADSNVDSTCISTNSNETISNEAISNEANSNETISNETISNEANNYETNSNETNSNSNETDSNNDSNSSRGDDEDEGTVRRLSEEVASVGSSKVSDAGNDNNNDDHYC